MPLNGMVDFEAVMRNKVARKTLRFFLRKFGVNVIIKREHENASLTDDNVSSVSELADSSLNVYGEYSGLSNAKEYLLKDTDGSINVEFSSRVLFTKVPTTPMDAAISGVLEQMIMYVEDENITTNDKVIIDANDGTTKTFLVGQPYNTGLTTDIYKSYEVNGLAE